MQTPQLSIIVPVYNECDHLFLFLEMLTLQQNICFELLLCDGGSTDGTAEEAKLFASKSPFPLYVLDCAKGRSMQMNAGVKSAAAETLLFLHVDSRFNNPNSLHNGWTQLCKIQKEREGWLAGHYSLKFQRQDHSSSPLYYHMESKARLNREECTHGDQGFMLNKLFFQEVGPFDDLYPIAEDTRFAERVRLKGEWILFPETIETSARRFEVEGIAERQTFNSILMNFTSIGWIDFFNQASAVYATQDSAGRLNLAPYLRLIHNLLKGMPISERLRFWYGTGRYVRDNAWQIPYYFDTRSHYRVGLLPGRGENSFLLFHDRWVEPLLDHPPGRILAGFLTWCWLQFSLIRFAIRSG
jgi:rSAM/selenodomain-associated transferase 2